MKHPVPIKKVAYAWHCKGRRPFSSADGNERGCDIYLYRRGKTIDLVALLGFNHWGLPLGSVKDPPLGSKDYLEKKTIISNYIGIQSYLHNVVVVVVVRLDRQTTNSIDNIASSSLVRSRAIAVAFP